MDKIAALHELLKQASSDHTSLTAYKRATRALAGLGIAGTDQWAPLSYLGYVRSDTGEPYAWLAKKIAEKQQRP